MATACPLCAKKNCWLSRVCVGYWVLVEGCIGRVTVPFVVGHDAFERRGSVCAV